MYDNNTSQIECIESPSFEVEAVSSVSDDNMTNSIGNRRLRSGLVMNCSQNSHKNNSNSDRSQRNTTKLVHTAQIADRYNLSNTQVAAVGNALLMDLNIVNSQDSSKLIDPNKVRRNRNIQRQKLTQSQKENRTPLIAFFFDGRRDSTKMYANKKILTEREEHISMLQMPGSIYIGHVSIADDKSDSLSTTEEIIDFLGKEGISTQSMLIVGCDGCASNTGWKGGIIFHLERKLKRPLQWIICLLHLIELPVRKMIKTHDGRTTGPKTYAGTIGQELEGCEKLPIVRFKRIEFSCPVNLQEVSDSLSTDQRYLFEIGMAISTGICETKLGNKSPGRIGHSRWLTTANRLCRLYVSKTKPTELLQLLVEYVLKVYAPAHFQIKRQSSCVYGAIHLCNMIVASRFLDSPYQKTFQDTLQFNGFFGHPENVLLAILNDKNEEVRYRGWAKIMDIRRNSDTTSFRQFKVPKLNFSARNYTELVDWENELKSVPPVLNNFDFGAADARVFAKKKLSEHELGFNIMEVPCHTQAVERCVKLVTESANSVCGEERRNGAILSTLQFRQNMKKFRTKGDFNVTPKNIKQVSV